MSHVYKSETPQNLGAHRYELFENSYFVPGICLLILVFSPYLFYTYGFISSLGMSFALVCSFIILLIAINGGLKQKHILISGVFFAILPAGLITLHRLISLRLDESIDSRFYFSILALSILLFFSRFCYKFFFETSQRDLNKFSLLILGIFLTFALISIAEIPLFQSPIFIRSIGPFSEPSHFALAAAPWLLMATLSLRNQVAKIFVLLCFFATGIIEQSLVTIVVVIVTAIISLRVIVIVPAILFVSAAMTLIDIGYFTDRLDISEHSQNLSVLVFLQGFEFITSALELTSGMGLGFQQLGVVPLYSPTSEIIRSLSGQYLNFNDGSFLASKAISEFGIFGIILCVAIAVKSALLIIKYRKYINSPNYDAGMKLSIAACVFYNVEIWIRGVGYFSVGTALFVMALLYIRDFEKASKSV